MDIEKRPETTATRGDSGPVRIERLCYNPEPDYTRPLCELPGNTREQMLARLRRLYGEAKAREALPELERVLKVHYAHKPPQMIERERAFDRRERFTEKDMVLITYGDLFHGGERTPLATLHRFIDTYNRGGYVSYKTAQDGREEPYEINCTWWSAINRDGTDDPLALQARRYIASRSIALALKGVPGMYIHGILGTANNRELAEKTGVRRDINRSYIDGNELERSFRAPDSRLSLVRRVTGDIYLIRSGQRAFHPRGEQKVLMLAPDVFSVLRASPEGDQRILAITNVTGSRVAVDVPLEEIGFEFTHCTDLLTGSSYSAAGPTLGLSLGPFDVLWLKPAGKGN